MCLKDDTPDPSYMHTHTNTPYTHSAWIKIWHLWLLSSIFYIIELKPKGVFLKQGRLYTKNTVSNIDVFHDVGTIIIHKKFHLRLHLFPLWMTSFQYTLFHIFWPFDFIVIITLVFKVVSTYSMKLKIVCKLDNALTHKKEKQNSWYMSHVSDKQFHKVKKKSDHHFS